MKPTSRAFAANSQAALKDPQLQRALGRLRSGFIAKRSAAVAALPEFESIRAAARAIKDHTLSHLDHYLVQFEHAAQASGGQVHWAETPADLARIVTEICRASGGRKVTKGKSMIGEECAVNDALNEAGFEVIETDLGEYIIQLAKEPPSHIIAPAIHKTRDQIADLFRTRHRSTASGGNRDSVAALVDEARAVLRGHFITADVGITGANFLVAETGSVVLVTNEGNGDLTATLPPVHIVMASIDKVVPTLEDAATLLRLLGRSASGQEMSVYTTLFTGPRRAGDPDGPGTFHIVLLDNQRSGLLGGEFQDILSCIRCAACLNHCPVYSTVGGHAYGWVYQGPMGSVLTPLLLGLKEAGDLPNASTLCGRCEQICPLGIPLPRMLRALRTRQHAARLDAPRQRWGLRLWGHLARRPRLYRAVTGVVARVLGRLGRGQGRLSRLTLAGGWTFDRDLPAPQGRTFVSAWQRRGGGT